MITLKSSVRHYLCICWEKKQTSIDNDNIFTLLYNFISFLEVKNTELPATAEGKVVHQQVQPDSGIQNTVNGPTCRQLQDQMSRKTNLS